MVVRAPTLLCKLCTHPRVHFGLVQTGQNYGIRTCMGDPVANDCMLEDWVCIASDSLRTYPYLGDRRLRTENVTTV